MLSEFSALEARDTRSAERVTQLINHLLRHQFVHIDDRSAAGHLETLQRRPLYQFVADWFDVAGYRLVLNEVEGWAGVVPDSERVTLPRLRTDETVVLLLLRRLWEEGVQSGAIVRRGCVLLTLNEAHAAYVEIVGKGRRAALSITAFREVLVGFSRKALLHLGAFDEEQNDMELTIRPNVAVVASDEFVDALDRLVARVELEEADLPEGEQEEALS
ncbi:hypothetical protein D3C71_182460 [compost metagenome]